MTNNYVIAYIYGLLHIVLDGVILNFKQGRQKFEFCPSIRIFKPLDCHSDGYQLIFGFRVGTKGVAKRLARTRTCTRMRVVPVYTHAHVVRWTPAVVGATTLNLQEVKTPRILLVDAYLPTWLGIFP